MIATSVMKELNTFTSKNHVIESFRDSVIWQKIVIFENSVKFKIPYGHPYKWSETGYLFHFEAYYYVLDKFHASCLNGFK